MVSIIYWNSIPSVLKRTFLKYRIRQSNPRIVQFEGTNCNPRERGVQFEGTNCNPRERVVQFDGTNY